MLDGERERREECDEREKGPAVLHLTRRGQPLHQVPRQVDVEGGEGQRPGPLRCDGLGIARGVWPRKHQKDEAQDQRQMERAVLDLDQQPEARRIDVKARQHDRDRRDQHADRPDQLAEVRLVVELADELRLLLGGNRLDLVGQRSAVGRGGWRGHRVAMAAVPDHGPAQGSGMTPSASARLPHCARSSERFPRSGAATDPRAPASRFPESGDSSSRRNGCRCA